MVKINFTKWSENTVYFWEDRVLVSGKLLDLAMAKYELKIDYWIVRLSFAERWRRFFRGQGFSAIVHVQTPHLFFSHPAEPVPFREVKPDFVSKYTQEEFQKWAVNRAEHMLRSDASVVEWIKKNNPQLSTAPSYPFLDPRNVFTPKKKEPPTL